MLHALGKPIAMKKVAATHHREEDAEHPCSQFDFLISTSPKMREFHPYSALSLVTSGRH